MPQKHNESQIVTTFNTSNNYQLKFYHKEQNSTWMHNQQCTLLSVLCLLLHLSKMLLVTYL